MSVTLSPQLADLVNRKVASGKYAGPDQVLRAALDLLDRRDRMDALRASIAEADAEIDRGEGIDWYPGFMDDLVWESEERYLRGERPNPNVCS